MNPQQPDIMMSCCNFFLTLSIIKIMCRIVGQRWNAFYFTFILFKFEIKRHGWITELFGHRVSHGLCDLTFLVGESKGLNFFLKAC